MDESPARCRRCCGRRTTRSRRSAGCTWPRRRRPRGWFAAASCCWPPESAGRPTTSALRALGRELVEADVAGLVLELGDRCRSRRPRWSTEFRAAGLPFVVLHREARFVAITEAVHSRIIADQMVALRARDEIHALFTELSLRGSPADFIVAQAARVLGSPVVLEDTSHQVIVAAAGLARTTARGRRLARRVGAALARGPPAAAVTAGWTADHAGRGARHAVGSPVALPGEPHPAGRSNVLEQAAVALALSRLSDRDEDEWTRRSHDALLGRAARPAVRGRGRAGRAIRGGGIHGDRTHPVRGRGGRASASDGRERSGDAFRLRRLARGAEAARAAGVDAVAAEHPELPVGRRTLVVALSARPGRAPRGRVVRRRSPRAVARG